MRSRFEIPLRGVGGPWNAPRKIASSPIAGLAPLVHFHLHLESMAKKTHPRRSDAIVPGQPYNLKFNVYNDEEGVWEFTEDEEKSIIESLKKDSDRAVAIIAGSMIETRLESAILARTRRDSVVENRLFQPSGPLGSFATKIDLAYLLGHISAEAFHDLVIVKDIRNMFAHRLDIKDFDTPSVRDKTKNLSLVESHVGNFTGAIGETLMRPMNTGDLTRLNVYNYEQKKSQPRARYLMTAQLFVGCMIGGIVPNSPTPFI
jgi:DNA-binding MltR family transcriptional regulator